jgi:hypothetical protein
MVIIVSIRENARVIIFLKNDNYTPYSSKGSSFLLSQSALLILALSIPKLAVLIVAILTV